MENRNPRNASQDQTRAGQADNAKEAVTKFVFVGDPNDNYSGPNVLTQHGVRFVKNKPAVVPKELAAKFESHTHFLTPDKAAKLQDRLLAAQEAELDDELDEDADEDAPAPRRAPTPGRPVRGEPPKGAKNAASRDGKNYDEMTMAQLHMEVAEQGKTAKGDASKDELVALLKSE